MRQNTVKSCQETFLICDFFPSLLMYINNILVAVCVAKLNLFQHCFHTICSTSKFIILLIARVTTGIFLREPGRGSSTAVPRWGGQQGLESAQSHPSPAEPGSAHSPCTRAGTDCWEEEEEDKEELSSPHCTHSSAEHQHKMKWNPQPRNRAPRGFDMPESLNVHSGKGFGYSKIIPTKCLLHFDRAGFVIWWDDF